VDRLQHVGEDRADDEAGLVLLDKPPRPCHGDIGLQLVIDHDQVDVAPAELPVVLLDVELEPVARVLPENGAGS
jgi:hypothetical protein